jgi:hypothetical protein
MYLGRGNTIRVEILLGAFSSCGMRVFECETAHTGQQGEEGKVQKGMRRCKTLSKIDGQGSE